VERKKGSRGAEESDIEEGREKNICTHLEYGEGSPPTHSPPARTTTRHEGGEEDSKKPE